MTLTSRIATHVPDRLLAGVISLVYRRAEPELGRLDEICGRGGVMVDVGAWYGPWSRKLARRADRLVAFEPTSRCRVLRRTLPCHSEVIQAAASDHQGTGQLWTSAGSDGAEGLSSLTRRDIHDRCTEVPLVRIDDLRLTGVTFMKVDVEGHELAVLRGAAGTIRTDRPRLLLEVETRMQRIENLIGMLADWGYRGMVLTGGAWVPLEDFDLAEHQAGTVRTAQRGLFSRVLWPYPRYVNSVLFVPREPSEPAPHSSTGPTTAMK
jgi:FkbM family methyltransferase